MKFLFLAMFAVVVALFLKAHALLVLVPTFDPELRRPPSTTSASLAATCVHETQRKLGLILGT